MDLWQAVGVHLISFVLYSKINVAIGWKWKDAFIDALITTWGIYLIAK